MGPSKLLTFLLDSESELQGAVWGQLRMAWLLTFPGRRAAGPGQGEEGVEADEVIIQTRACNTRSRNRLTDVGDRCATRMTNYLNGGRTVFSQMVQAQLHIHRGEKSMLTLTSCHTCGLSQDGSRTESECQHSTQLIDAVRGEEGT